LNYWQKAASPHGQPLLLSLVRAIEIGIDCDLDFDTDTDFDFDCD